MKRPNGSSEVPPVPPRIVGEEARANIYQIARTNRLAATTTTDAMRWTAFDEFVNMLVKASQDMNSAIESEQFEKFDLARSQMGQACTLCHTDYRG